MKEQKLDMVEHFDERLEQLGINNPTKNPEKVWLKMMDYIKPFLEKTELNRQDFETLIIGNYLIQSKAFNPFFSATMEYASIDVVDYFNKQLELYNLTKFLLNEHDAAYDRNDMGGFVGFMRDFNNMLAVELRINAEITPYIGFDIYMDKVDMVDYFGKKLEAFCTDFSDDDTLADYLSNLLKDFNINWTELYTIVVGNYLIHNNYMVPRFGATMRLDAEYVKEYINKNN